MEETTTATISDKPLVNARQAVERAIQYYRDVANDYSSPSVEEVRLSKDGLLWNVTLGISKRSAPNPFQENIVYKAFEVDASTGEVLGMKIWKQ